MLSKRWPQKRTNRHALLGAQYLCAETLGSHQGLHLISNNVANRLAILLLQILLAMHNINAQSSERFRGAVHLLHGLVPTASLLLPLGERLVGAAALRSSSGGTHSRDLGREGGKLVDEVLGAEVAVELLVRPAGRPGALYEDGGERGGYLGRCRAPDGDRLRGGGEAVGGDVAKEEEFLAGGVVPDEERGGLVVAERVVLPVQHGHRLDRHVGESRPVSCVELESVFFVGERAVIWLAKCCLYE